MDNTNQTGAQMLAILHSDQQLLILYAHAFIVAPTLYDNKQYRQGFSVIGQVDTKGRARRLPIKADIRKALCFLGGSNLMISHFNKDNLHGSAVYLNLKFPLKPSRENCRSPILQEQRDTLSEGDNLSQSRNQATKTADSNYYGKLLATW